MVRLDVNPKSNAGSADRSERHSALLAAPPAALILYLGIAPAGRHDILIPLLAVFVALGGIRWLARGAFRAKNTPSAILLFAAAGAFPVVVGAIADAPGWLDVAIPLVAGPVAWYFIGMNFSKSSLNSIMPAIGLATISVGAVQLATFQGTTVPILSSLQSTAWAGTERVNLTAATSLIALVPCLVTYLVEAKSLSLPWVRLSSGATIVGVASALTSGRQSVLAAVAMAPILVWLVRHPRILGSERMGLAERSGRLARWTFATVCAILAVGLGSSLLGRDPIRLIANFTSAIGITEAQENRIEFAYGTRVRQQRSLLAGWMDSPLWGSGAGSVREDYIDWRPHRTRIAERPWRAELQYHLLLFEGGAMALLFYGLASKKALQRVRTRCAAMAPQDAALTRVATVGGLALAIATASNPYVRAVGQQWILFLPVIIAFAATQSSRETH